MSTLWTVLQIVSVVFCSLGERNEDRRQNVCMEKTFISNNVFEWSKHIDNLVEQGKMEKAMSAARDMMNRGIEPDVTTFTTLIKGWCEVGNMLLAMHVAKVMLKMNLYPNEITYSISVSYTHLTLPTKRIV